MNRWRKSSRSGANGQTGCVEIAHDLRAVRDSKNPNGPVLTVDVRALLAALRAERLLVSVDALRGRIGDRPVPVRVVFSAGRW